jgi:uncharacterized protein
MNPDIPLQSNRLNFVLKVVSRCNLNCSYCYVYNKGDTTWLQRPTVMPEKVFSAALRRIRHWCQRSNQQSVRVTFHGGEPLLVQRDRFDDWCTRLRGELSDTARVTLAVQTNATLLDDEWIDLLRRHEVEVGVSIDGPPDVHDLFRLDRRGGGSYAAVERGIHRMAAAGLAMGALCVIPLGTDGIRVHQHLAQLGFHSINYLLPDYTHDTIAPVHRQYGQTPCADFLIPVFDEWWYHGDLSLWIPLFSAIARLVLGGESVLDLFGNAPFGFVFIETDGSIEGLDVLRVCRNGMSATGISVLNSTIARLAEVSDLHRQAIFTGVPIPTACAGCPEERTCSGGYLPHRWSTSRQFDNRSVWCADLLKLFAHIRHRLEVPVAETALRRQALNLVASDAAKGLL